MLVENDTSNLSTNHHLSKDVSNIVTFLNVLKVFYEWEERTLLQTAKESNVFRSVCLRLSPKGRSASRGSASEGGVSGEGSASGGGDLPTVWGGGDLPTGGVCPTPLSVLTSSGCHCNSRYASYLNAFLLPPANVVCEGYIFTGVCDSVNRGGMCGFIWGGMHGFIRGACLRGFIWGGHAWFYLGGMRGFIWGGMCGFIRGACVVLFGGACMVLFGGGACVVFPVFPDTMRYGQ